MRNIVSYEMDVDLYTTPYEKFSYKEIISRLFSSFENQWKKTPPSLDSVKNFTQDVTNYNQLERTDFLYMMAVAVVFIIYRYLMSNLIWAPIGKWLQFKKKDQIKFPESAAKLFYFIIFAAYEYYLINYKYSELRYIPGAAWVDWHWTIDVPRDIYILYIVQAGSYFYGVYGTLFLDIWRKDSIAMLFHHIIANSLIIFSLAFRCHKIGLVVLYLHDMADVALETTKIFTCFNNRDKSKFWDFLTTCGFLWFTAVWFFQRLYVYPLVVLFSTGHVLDLVNGNNDIFYFFFNGMLWTLFALNVWWFMFIVDLIFRIVTGKSRVEDTREDEEEERTKKNV